jgi:hypothetical protein
MNDRHRPFPEKIENFTGAKACFLAARNFHVSAGEIIVLDVDQKKCRAHIFLSKGP